MSETTICRKQVANNFFSSHSSSDASTDRRGVPTGQYWCDLDYVALRYPIQKESNRTSTDRSNKQILGTVVVEICRDDGP